MSDTDFERFVGIFNERVRDWRIGEPEVDDVAPLETRESATTQVFIEDLVDGGHLGDCEIVYFEKKLGRGIAKLNGYAISEDEGQVDLVVTVLSDGTSSPVASSDVSKAARRALHLYRAAAQPLHNEMEPSSPAYDMVEQLHSTREGMNRIRVIVLTDGRVGSPPQPEQPDDLPEVRLDIWDIERLFRATSSGLTYESVAIDFEEALGEPLPCLEGARTAEDHRCYLAIIPGDLLHDLYHEHGPRLLELNVRSFLQARGKVNRGIRDTLLHDPEHFLAFNNGLSATVEEMELTASGEGCAIRSVKGLQIVNGGQTVASIHRAKDRDKVDLSAVSVQAKITVVDVEHLDKLVPNISRYSNTQNKVNETDFSANHPFHVRIQQLSERIWAPGEVTRWFYERARGQWEVARAREGTTPARKRAFDQRTPRSQRLDKALLAKSMNAWEELPHIVSRGGQKNFVHFMKGLSANGVSWEPDDEYYRHLIGRVIVFKSAERVARQIKFSGYSANAVCYSVAMLAYRTAGRINLDQVWLQQDVSEALRKTMLDWMPRIHEEIIVSAQERNVTEWCKKLECWTHLQTLRLDLSSEFESELADGLALPTVGIYKESKGSSARSLTPEERDRQALTMKYSAEEWVEIMEWAHKSGEVSSFQLNVAGTIIGYAASGWRQVPSPKQTKHTVAVIDLWLAHNRENNVAEVDA